MKTKSSLREKAVNARRSHFASAEEGTIAPRRSVARRPRGGATGSELFGHQKESSDDAISQLTARLESANNGTLCLEEITSAAGPLNPGR